MVLLKVQSSRRLWPVVYSSQWLLNYWKNKLVSRFVFEIALKYARLNRFYSRRSPFPRTLIYGVRKFRSTIASDRLYTWCYSISHVYIEEAQTHCRGFSILDVYSAAFAKPPYIRKLFTIMDGHRIYKFKTYSIYSVEFVSLPRETEPEPPPLAEVTSRVRPRFRSLS